MASGYQSARVGVYKGKRKAKKLYGMAKYQGGRAVRTARSHVARNRGIYTAGATGGTVGLAYGVGRSRGKSMRGRPKKRRRY